MSLVLFLLGICCIFVSSKSHGGLGYRGISTYYFGMKVWKYSNLIFGRTITTFSVLLFIISITIDITENLFRAYILILAILSLVITDTLTFIKYKQKK